MSEKDCQERYIKFVHDVAKIENDYYERAYRGQEWRKNWLERKTAKLHQ